MKKILFLLTALMLGSLTYAATVTPTTNTASSSEPDYTAVKKRHETFYFDKYGKMIARDKEINNQIFFYNNVGQLVGKSLKRADRTYYYNQLGNFLGVCDADGTCQDKDFVSTGNITPLPTIKKFTPYFDPELLNPPKANSGEE